MLRSAAGRARWPGFPLWVGQDSPPTALTCMMSGVTLRDVPNIGAKCSIRTQKLVSFALRRVPPEKLWWMRVALLKCTLAVLHHAWTGWRQGNSCIRWFIVAFLVCNSFVWLGYRSVSSAVVPGLLVQNCRWNYSNKPPFFSSYPSLVCLSVSVCQCLSVSVCL